MAFTVWRGHLTFGLISIPVRLFRAARAERITLRRVTRAKSSEEQPEFRNAEDQPSLSRVQNTRAKVEAAQEGHAPIPVELPQSAAIAQPLVPVRQANVAAFASISSAVIPQTQVTHGVEVEKNRFVEIPSEELKTLKIETSRDMAIQQFVSLAQIDPLYFETSYYVIPEEVGEKAYALLYQSLRDSHVVALAEMAMHGRDHIVVVRPGLTGLVAHTMFYQNEVHLDEQFRADVAAVNAKELTLAQRLIESLTAEFEPEVYKNRYQENLSQLVSAKVGQDGGSRTQPVVREKAPVVDIADALRASLAQLKKPSQNTAEAKPKTATRRKSAKSGAA